MAKKLICNSRYVNRNLDYQAGAIIEVSDAEAAYLMADAPGVFEEYVEETTKVVTTSRRKRVAKPAQDKAVKEPGKDK